MASWNVPIKRCLEAGKVGKLGCLAYFGGMDKNNKLYNNIAYMCIEVFEYIVY